MIYHSIRYFDITVDPSRWHEQPFIEADDLRIREERSAQAYRQVYGALVVADTVYLITYNRFANYADSALDTFVRRWAALELDISL